MLARGRRGSRGPAHRRRGRAARRQARRSRPHALLLVGRCRSRRRDAQPAVRSRARGRGRSVPPVPGAHERGDRDPQSRSLAVVPARRSVAPAPASSSTSASRTTARSTITRRRCSIACAARCSIPPTRSAAPATATATSSSSRRAARIASISSRSRDASSAPSRRRWRRWSPRCCASSRGSPSARARVLGNSLIRPERLTARLVTDAADNARNLRERKAHRDRSTLQDVILGEGLTSGVPADRRPRHRRHLRVRGADARPARHVARVARDAVRDRRRGRPHRRARPRVLPRRAAQRDDARAGAPPVRQPLADVVLRLGVHRGRGRQSALGRRPHAREHRLRDHRAARDRELRVVQARARARTPRWASASRSTTSARATRTSRP